MLGRYFLVAALVVTPCAAKGPIAHKKAPERLEKTIVVVDTADREAWLYKPVFDMIKNLGYSVDYKPLDQVLDEDSIPRSAGVFFIFGTEFLSVLNKSHVCTKVLQLLHFAAQQTGTLVGLAFPSMRTTQGMNLVAACARIFDQLGVKTPPTAVEYPFPPMLAAIDEKASDDMAVRAFFYLTNIFLSTPLESRPLDFHTTLSLPRAQGIEFDVDQMKEVLQVHGCNLSLMPRLAVCSPVIKKTLPYGVYWYNHVRKNHVLVTTTNILSFAGITENFHVTPINVGLRIEMLQQVHRMLWETLVLSQLANKAAVTQALRTLDEQVAPQPPQETMEVRFASPTSNDDNKRKIAWMDIDVFAPCTPDEVSADPDAQKKRDQQQHDLISNIVAAGLDGLWITANPHMYFSPIAKHAAPEKKAQYLAMLGGFTERLAAGCKAAGARVPSLYIGFEIANNLYPPHLPVRYAVDVYENVYKDLPVGIDMAFWQQEVLGPFRQLAKAWQEPAVAHGVPLAGVVLDLEMYCRKKSGSFTTVMGFDDFSFQRFIKHQNLGWGSVAMRDRPLKLMERKAVGAYYRFLEQEAESVGTQLKDGLHTILPGAAIMCYMPHIQISWFYKGLVKGLTDAKKPMQLLTFNSEFVAHQEWFDQQRSPVTHACVLMLSKIREVTDFDWVSHLLLRHGAIWLNRFSRTVEPLAKDWRAIEQLALPTDQAGQFYSFVRSQ